MTAADMTTREHVVLAQEAQAAGLIVTDLMPKFASGEVTWYSIQLWQPDGALWAEASSETASTVRWHIQGYVNR